MNHKKYTIIIITIIIIIIIIIIIVIVIDAILTLNTFLGDKEKGHEGY